MLSFECDYNKGAHKKILERLLETNEEPAKGYGFDPYCASAAEKILKACELAGGQVQFLTGGTQTNQIVIDAMLAGYEAVVAADTGHVNFHEAGAIEYTGHKVLTIPHVNGKLDAGDLEQYLKDYYADDNHEHMARPGMVYISHPSEYGTLYSKAELEALSSVCKTYELPLFMDGARLGYGLMSKDTDVTLSDIAKLCDVFYIGGTKVGALCGEAVVFTHGNMPKHFLTTVKQHGALNAKGRLLGVQFDTLFTDDLYFEISKHAIEMAEKLKNAFKEKGYQFLIDSPTNQIFVILDNEKKKELEKEARFGFWEKYDETHTVVRIATSWGTTEEELNALIELI